MKLLSMLGAALAAAILGSSGCTMILGDVEVEGEGGEGGGANGCATRDDCSACPDYATCFECESNNHPRGSELFGFVFSCVSCTACYVNCSGASVGCGAATDDTCDASTSTCYGDGGCYDCAVASTCKNQLDDCLADGDCVAFINAGQACPKN